MRRVQCTARYGFFRGSSEKTTRIASASFEGIRCRYLLLISSVWCPIQASINLWSIPLAAQLLANEWRKTWNPRTTSHLEPRRVRLR